MDLTQLLSSVAPLIQAGTQYSLARDSAAQQNAAAARSAQGARDAAEALQEGYRGQLAATEAGAKDVETGLTKAYNEGLAKIPEQAQQYRQMLLDYTDQYGTQAGDMFDRYASGVSNLMDPLMTEGDKGISYYSNELGRDPSQLDPAQKRAFDNYRRESMAQLATSGLRGAGRSVARAINEGDATFMANAYEQNKARQDRAASALAPLSSSTRDKLATVGKQSVDYGDQYLTARLKAGTEGSAQEYNANKAAVEGKGDLYKNIANLDSSLAAARGSTAMGIAGAEASAHAARTDANRAADLKNAATRGEALGKIASVFAPSGITVK